MITILCLLMMYAGFGFVLYGLYQMNDITANLIAMFSSSFNPGILWVIGGALLVILGTIILLVREFKKPKRKY